VDGSLNRWFKQEILAHERTLLRFLRRVWPDPSEVDDLCQETYVRVYEAAAKSLPAVPQAFLFATARNLMADRVRRSKIVSIEMKGDLDSLNVLVEELSPEHRLSARQDLWRLAVAFERLPPLSREVVWLVKVDALPQKDVARRLGITHKAVQNRIARGIRMLQDVYFGGKGLDLETTESGQVGSESEHG